MDFLASVRAIFGENTEDFLKLYKVTEENFQRACLDAQRDYGFLNIQRVLSRLSKVHPCPVYQYYFVEPIVLEDGTFVGATHSAETLLCIPYLVSHGGQHAGGEADEAQALPGAVCLVGCDGELLEQFCQTWRSQQSGASGLGTAQQHGAAVPSVGSGRNPDGSPPVSRKSWNF